MRFKDLEKTLFMEAPMGAVFYAAALDGDSEPTAMKHLEGPYSKMRAKAHVLGRTDVDRHVKLVCARAADGALVEFDAYAPVWAVKLAETPAEEDIPF